jgi:hypothetical protein
VAFSISDAQNILKAVYLPPIRELLNNSTPLLKYIEKEVQETEGLSFNIPLHVSRNEAAGDGRAENGSLPSAGKQGYSNAIVPSKYLYSRISVSGPVIAATKSNKGSFLRALDAEMRGVSKDTRRSFNRQLHGDGRDSLGQWVSTTNGTTAIFDDGLGNVGADFINTGAQTVDVVQNDNATKRFSAVAATRSTLAATGRNVTFASTAGMTTGDYLTRAGALGNQMTGILAVISDGNPALLSGGLHGVTVAAQPDWVAQMVYANGGSTEAATAASRVDLAFSDLQKVFSAIAANSDYTEQDIKLILASYAMRDTYVQLCRNERVFYNNMKLDGGFEAVSYNGKPIVPDVHARHNRLQFICPDSLAIFRLADLDWMDKDGNILYRLSGGDVDGYGATLFVYQELGCKVRNANGALLNVNEI